jgi:acyl dehydratase
VLAQHGFLIASGGLFVIDGPYYDDFEVGMTIPPLPSVTLGPADNVTYRAITGDQHLPSTDDVIGRAVTGADAALVNPGIAMQYSIGQTTNATRRAIANLYYRQVRLHRPVHVGETLTTQTTVLGLKDASPKGELHRGRVWLGIETRVDGELFAAYQRCALLPSRGGSPGHADDIPGPDDPGPLDDLADLVPSWDLSPLPSVAWPTGEERTDPMRDHVDQAPGLARLTFNQAQVHRDHTRSAYGRRLVYGGHVQALAQASLSRLLPGLATVVAWDGCDHLGPAFEGDLLEFRHTPVDELVVGSGRLIRLAVRAAPITDDGRGEDILAWSPIVVAP